MRAWLAAAVMVAAMAGCSDSAPEDGTVTARLRGMPEGGDGADLWPEEGELIVSQNGERVTSVSLPEAGTDVILPPGTYSFEGYVTSGANNDRSECVGQQATVGDGESLTVRLVCPMPMRLKNQAA